MGYTARASSVVPSRTRAKSAQHSTTHLGVPHAGFTVALETVPNGAGTLQMVSVHIVFLQARPIHFIQCVD